MKNFIKILASITAIAAWFAVTSETYFVITNASTNGFTIPEALGKFFSHGTILTNLLVAINLSVLLLFPNSAVGKFFARPFIAGETCLYILMVGFAYNLLMRQFSTAKGWQEVNNELLHVIVPAFYFLYWFLFAAKNSLQWKDVFRWLLWPAIYFSYLIVRGAIDGFYPYTFINVNELGYGQTLLRAAASGVGIIILGLSLVAIARLQKRKTI